MFDLRFNFFSIAIDALHCDSTCKTIMLIDLIQVRCHIEFNMAENEAVRDRLAVFTMAHSIKVLVSCNFHNFQNFSTTSKKVLFCFYLYCFFLERCFVS